MALFPLNVSKQNQYMVDMKLNIPFHNYSRKQVDGCIKSFLMLTDLNQKN